MVRLSHAQPNQVICCKLHRSHRNQQFILRRNRVKDAKQTLKRLSQRHLYSSYLTIYSQDHYEHYMDLMSYYYNISGRLYLTVQNDLGLLKQQQYICGHNLLIMYLFSSTLIVKVHGILKKDLWQSPTLSIMSGARAGGEVCDSQPITKHRRHQSQLQQWSHDHTWLHMIGMAADIGYSSSVNFKQTS